MECPTSTTLLSAAIWAAGGLAAARAESPPLTGVRPMNLAYVFDWQPEAGQNRLTRLDATPLTLDDDGQLIAFDDSGPTHWPGAVFDAGNDGIIAWGRWTRDTIGGAGVLAGHSITGAEGVRNSFRYIAGSPVADDAFAAMKAAGGPATFSLLGGGTGPTAGEGGGVSITLLTAGQLELKPQSEMLDLQLSFRVASGIYTLVARDIPVEGHGFESVEPIPTTGVLCIAGCTARVSGFFAGDKAQRVGVAFSVHNPALSKHINGIAAFTRD